MVCSCLYTTNKLQKKETLNRVDSFDRNDTIEFIVIYIGKRWVKVV